MKSFTKNNFVQDGFGSQSRHAYRYVPWIKESVRKIVVKPLNEYARDLVTGAPDRSGFYTPNKRYYELQAASTVSRSQKDDTLFLGACELQVRIITRSGSVIVQDEKIFECERKYMESLRKYGSVHVEEYSERVRMYPEFFLSKACSNYAYVKAVVDEYEKKYSQNPHVFIDYMSDLMALMTDKNFADKFSTCSLIPEMLPLMCHDSVRELQVLVVNSNKHKISQEWLRQLSSGRRRTNATPLLKSGPKIVDISVWKDLCRNRRDLADVASDDELVFLSENDSLYGFRIDDMFDLIQTTGRNPYTETLLDKSFVQRFADTHPRPVSSRSRQRAAATLVENVLEKMLDSFLSNLETQ